MWISEQLYELKKTVWFESHLKIWILNIPGLLIRFKTANSIVSPDRRNVVLSANFVHRTAPLGSDLPELQSDKISILVPHNTRPAIDQAVRAFLYLYIGMAKKYSHWPVIRVEVESEFPPGAGLGSSAAFSVSLTAALFKIMTGDDPSSQTISAWAFRCEHLFHGKPSGIDNSICAYGGAILFQSGEVVEMLSGLRKLPALLVYTNVTRNTKVLVGAVSKLREKV